MEKADLAFGRAHLAHSRRIRDARGVLIPEELDVAAQRYCGDLPARPVAVIEADQFRAKPDGEHQDLYAAGAGNQEMAKLMEKHHDRQDDEKRDHVPHEANTQDIETPKQISTHGIPFAPAQSSPHVQLPKLVTQTGVLAGRFANSQDTQQTSDSSAVLDLIWDLAMAAQAVRPQILHTCSLPAKPKMPLRQFRVISCRPTIVKYGQQLVHHQHSPVPASVLDAPPHRAFVRPAA